MFFSEKSKTFAFSITVWLVLLWFVYAFIGIQYSAISPYAFSFLFLGTSVFVIEFFSEKHQKKQEKFLFSFIVVPLFMVILAFFIKNQRKNIPIIFSNEMIPYTLLLCIQCLPAIIDKKREGWTKIVQFCFLLFLPLLLKVIVYSY